MTVRQLPSPKWTVPGTSGGVASGFKVYTYIPGTTTPKATYTTSAGDVANANPVVLDSRGEATIFWDGIYKVVVKTPADVTVWTEDNYGSGLVPVTSTQLSLVPNYSFEEATEDVNVPDNWTITTYTGGTQTLDTAEANVIHGGKSLKFTSTGSGGGFAESEFFPVRAGNLLSVLFALRSTATVRNVVEILWYTNAQVSISSTSIYDEDTSNPASMTDTIGAGVAPITACFAKIRLTGCHSSDPTSGFTVFDDIRVKGDELPRTYRGSFATLLAATTGDTITLTHGLGVDGCNVFLRAKGSVDSNWRVTAIMPDGGEFVMRGRENSTTTADAPATPSAGQINIRVYNASASQQTITVNFNVHPPY